MSEREMKLKLPILVNHDPATPPIGYLRVEGGRLMVEFSREARITRERFFEIFSGAGVRMLEVVGEVGDDGEEAVIIRKGEILEFSLQSLPRPVVKGGGR